MNASIDAWRVSNTINQGNLGRSGIASTGAERR
jgi:hypothetical protein